MPALDRVSIGWVLGAVEVDAGADNKDGEETGSLEGAGDCTVGLIGEGEAEEGEVGIWGMEKCKSIE